MRRLLLMLASVVLVPVGVFAQTGQVVEYYHTDVLGSVRAVTNAQGQVVSRHDFMPFGEEVAPANPPTEKRLFTGKERDAETGLDYFGARYAATSHGRFASPDPLDALSTGTLTNPQGWNSYVYSYNNPVRYVDQDGQFPTPAVAWLTGTHNRIIAAAFPGLSPEELGWIQQGSYFADTDLVYNGGGTAEPANAFIHGMTNGTGKPPQSVAAAKAQMNAFVEQYRHWSITASNSRLRLFNFGVGTHPVVDQFCPQHNWQPWNGGTGELLFHGAREAWRAPLQETMAVQALIEQYQLWFGREAALRATTPPALVPLVTTSETFRYYPGNF